MFKSLTYVLASLLLLIVISVPTGCSDDSPTEVNVETVAWELNASFEGDRQIMLNADVCDDGLFIAGISAMTQLEAGDLIPDLRGPVFGERTLSCKPAVKGRAMMYRGMWSVGTLAYNTLGRGRCSLNQASYPHSTSFALAGLDSFFNNDCQILKVYFEQPLGAFNDQDQFLVAAQNPDQGEGITTGLCLINLNTQDDDSFWETPCRELSPEAIVIPLDTNTVNYVWLIEAIGDNFFVCTTNNSEIFHRIDPAGNMEICRGVNQRICDVFEYDEALWAFSNLQGALYRSTDQGLNWELVIRGLPGVYQKFFEMDGKMCFYTDHQIAYIDFDEEQYYTVNNTGLESVCITSVHEFDGRFWLATTNGLYSKDVSEFFALPAGATWNRSGDLQGTFESSWHPDK